MTSTGPTHGHAHEPPPRSAISRDRSHRLAEAAGGAWHDQVPEDLDKLLAADPQAVEQARTAGRNGIRIVTGSRIMPEAMSGER